MSATGEQILSALTYDWKNAETLVKDAGLEWTNANKCIAYRVLRGQVKFRFVEKKKVDRFSYWRLADEPKN